MYLYSRNWTKISLTYLILEPVMSSSMCIQDLFPALCSSRLTRIGAKKGFLASKGLQNKENTINV